MPAISRRTVRAPSPGLIATSSLVARLLRAGAPDRLPTEPEERSVGTARPLPASLLELRALVEQEAQRGCSGAIPGTVLTRLATAHAALRNAGLPIFTDPADGVGTAEALLRSLYLVQQVETALG